MAIEWPWGLAPSARFLALISTLALSACASSDPGARERDERHDARHRNIYSPDIADDPYVQRQWESGLSALEARCRETGEFCAEAERLRETVGRAR